MKEYSYGIIPFYKGENGIEVFVIHQYGSGGDILWTFPKGRQEAGETPIQTALRELSEETGIVIDSYDEETPYSLSYAFLRDGEEVEKTTTYYLGFAKHKTFTIQEKEIKEAGWFSISEAREKLTYPAYKELLDTVILDLDK